MEVNEQTHVFCTELLLCSVAGVGCVWHYRSAVSVCAYVDITYMVYVGAKFALKEIKAQVNHTVGPSFTWNCD